MSVLDIGCGRGYFCKKMAGKGAKVTGVDIVPEEIQVAQAVNAGSDTSFCCMNAEELEGMHEQFDLIISRYCFHHLDIPKARNGIQACLKPEGRMVVIDCHEDFWSLSGRWYVMKTAWQNLGTLAIFKILFRLGYFFTPARIEHVKSDIRRIKAQGRYTFEQVKKFYGDNFSGCEVGQIGCAFYIIWKKPTA
jgi:SAM-dependent methyltransferase